MGKWSTVALPVGLDERYVVLKTLSDIDINALWIANGSRSLGDFKCMSMYWSQMNSWACIDNAEGKDAPANFQIFFDYKITTNEVSSLHMVKIACILASEFNMEPTVTVDSSPQIDPEPKQVNPYYNDPQNPQFAIDFSEMHGLCRSAQVWYSLNYNEGSNLWDINIESSAECERYATKEHSLSLAIQDAVEHLEKIQPADYAPNWPDANDLKE